MYDRNKQESQTRRSQAVEKAMNMKIKKVFQINTIKAPVTCTIVTHAG